MKQKVSGLIMTICVGMLTAQAQADDYPACAASAAQEFAIPVQLFQAMALAEVQGASQYRAEPRNQYGPMGLGYPAIPAMASGLGVSVESVKEDACTNYRAAAWWFVNKAGGNQGDMWEAVTKFYYGKPTSANAHATDRVKKVYAKLRESHGE